MDEKQARQYAMAIHLSGLLGYIFPFGNIIGPLVMWLIKKDESPFIDFHGKEALNFQITVILWAILVGILSFFCIGLLLLPFLIIYGIVGMILGAIKANEGEEYLIPFTLRLIT